MAQARGRCKQPLEFPSSLLSEQGFAGSARCKEAMVHRWEGHQPSKSKTVLGHAGQISWHWRYFLTVNPVPSQPGDAPLSSSHIKFLLATGQGSRASTTFTAAGFRKDTHTDRKPTGNWLAKMSRNHHPDHLPSGGLT